MIITPKPLSAEYRQPKPDWLFDGFLRRKTLSMLAAGPFTGKTNLAIHMMLCAEFGLPLFGRFECEHPASFLFFEADSPEWDFDSLVERHAKGLGISDNDLAHCSARKVCLSGVRVLDQKFKDSLRRVASEGIQGVMFDTLRRYMEGNENDSGYMSQVMESFEWMRDELALTTIFLHHTGKPSPDTRRTYRGSEVIQGSGDYHVTLTKLKEDGMQIAYEKGRGHGMLESLVVQLEDTEDGGLKFSVLSGDPQADVMEAITRHGPIPRADLLTKLAWAGSLPFRRKRLDNHLGILRRKGRIQRTEAGWRLK